MKFLPEESFQITWKELLMLNLVLHFLSLQVPSCNCNALLLITHHKLNGVDWCFPTFALLPYSANSLYCLKSYSTWSGNTGVDCRMSEWVFVCILQKVSFYEFLFILLKFGLTWFLCLNRWKSGAIFCLCLPSCDKFWSKLNGSKFTRLYSSRATNSWWFNGITRFTGFDVYGN